VYSGKNLKGDFLEQGRTKQNKFDFTTSNKSYFFKVKAAIIDTTK